MSSEIQKLKGANMDIDLATPAGNIAWEQDGCPWNQAEGTDAHKCAVKNVSICLYFCGVEYMIRFCVVTPMKIHYEVKFVTR